MMSEVQTVERYQGRPVPDSDRLEKERRCYDLLDRLGVSYDRVDHEHADTIAQCLDIEAVLGAKICKNLFLCNRQKTDFYLLLMPGDKPFKTKFFSKLIGASRLSFAEAADMEHYLDITPGSVSVLGLMNDRDAAVRLYIDRPVIEAAYLGCHPCINTSTLRLKTADVLETVIPAMGHTATVIDLPCEE